MKRIKFLFYSFKEVHLNGKAFFWLYILKTILSTIKVYISAWFSKKLFNVILYGITLGEITRQLISLVIIVISIDIIFALINLITDYYSEKSALFYNNAFTLKNSQKCSRLKYQYHDAPTEKNQVKQFLNDGKSIMNVYCQTVSLLFTLISFITSLFIGLKFSIIVTIFSLIVAFPSFFIRKKNKNADYQLEKDLNLTDRIINYFKSVCTGKAFYKEIHTFGVIPFFLDKLTEVLNQRTDKRISLRKTKMLRELLLLFVFSIVNIVINLYIIIFIIIKKLTIGDYTYYTTIINNLKNNSDSLVTSTNDLFISLKRAENYFEFFNNKENEYDLGTKPMPERVDSILFSNVYFKYPNTDNYILKDVSFEVYENEKVALAGVNGAGKSTIINLLLRFYEPTQGKILINGCDVRYYKLDEYWKYFSCMLQQSNLYNISLRENLMLGNIKRLNTLDNTALCSLLCSLGLNNITSEDLNRYISKQFYDDGIIFSPGQAQKINVIRTLLANNSIVVLDEPSSSMDALTENMIMDTIFSFSENKMIFFISHRLSNMKKVDKIVFLDGGKVLETGTHESLMNLKGKYSELFEKQAKNFI